MSASFLTETIHISRGVLRGLETCSAMRGAQSADLPLTVGVDQIADAVLREFLASQPEVAEREAKVREFFKTLT